MLHHRTEQGGVSCTICTALNCVASPHLPLPCTVPAFSLERAWPFSTLTPGTVFVRFLKKRSFRSSLLYQEPRRPGSFLYARHAFSARASSS